MSPARSKNSIAIALWINAAVLAAILVALLARNNTSLLPAAYGQNQPNIAGGGGIFVMPGQLSANTWGCYLLDVDTQTLCAYEYLPGAKNLRLAAARDFKWDRKLKEFNTSAPTPREVKALIDKQEAGAAVGNAEKKTND
jgi:hypothetical protein